MKSKVFEIKNRAAKSERGASLAEYALLLALIVSIAVPSISHVGNATSDKFSEVDGALNTASHDSADAKPACTLGGSVCK